MELAHKLADFAEKLPIGKKLGTLDFSEPGILIGETACGKSMVTPVLAYLTGGFKRVIVRQPTRLASYLAMKSMQDIYGDFIYVGCINRDQKINPDAPILEVTDGILIDWLRDKKIWYDELIILDEIHATSEQLEIAMGLIRRQAIHPWCLSATIDPTDIKEYFQAKTHYVSGINYAINKKQIFKQLSDFFYGNRKEKGYIKEKILNRKNSCLVFLPTRFDTEFWAAEIDRLYGDEIICKYVHGGIDVKEVAPFAHKEEVGKPFMLFSTPVAEQSITLDLDDVVVLNQRVSVREYMGVKIQQRTPLPSNSMIQMMGRCGRRREGNVYLICDEFQEEIDFSKLKPTPVDYSLANNTPFELAIVLADRQVKLEDVELITEVNKEEYNFAIKMLKKRKIIGKNGLLTEEGHKVMNIPLDYNLAQFVATAPEEILDIVILTSGFGSHGLYHIEKMYPEGTPYPVTRERRRLSVSQSDLLTKYNMAREFYGLSEEAMNLKAEELGFNLHVILNALNAARSVYDHLELSPPAELPRLNRKLIETFQEHIFNIMLYHPTKVTINHHGNGYQCFIDDMKAFTDSASTIQGGPKEVIFSLRTKCENRFGEWYIRLSDNTICPKKYREWCWPEETVRTFFDEYFNITRDGSLYIPDKKYPLTYEFVSKILSLSKELEELFNKSPQSFKNSRIKYRKILNDTLLDICINEKIDNPGMLENYLATEEINPPQLEDFVSQENMNIIKETCPDDVEIKGQKYPLLYKNGVAFAEIPQELVFKLKADESPVNNFYIQLHKHSKKMELFAHSIEEARDELKSIIITKAWKKAERNVTKKINTSRLTENLKSIKKHITDFQQEPVYGWTGIKYEHSKFYVTLFKSEKDAFIQTRKAITEYVIREIQSHGNKLKNVYHEFKKEKFNHMLNNKLREMKHDIIEKIKSSETISKDFIEEILSDFEKDMTEFRKCVMRDA